MLVSLQLLQSCVSEGRTKNPGLKVSLWGCVSKTDLEAKEKLEYIRAVDKNKGSQDARITFVSVDDKRKVSFCEQ